MSTGRIVNVAGPVVDAEFPPDELPEIFNAVEVDIELGGETVTVVAEVAQHLGNSQVRAVAMRSTDGLVRGAEVRDTGAPISVPVGNETLGHIFNVLSRMKTGCTSKPSPTGAQSLLCLRDRAPKRSGRVTAASCSTVTAPRCGSSRSRPSQHLGPAQRVSSLRETTSLV